MQTLIKITNFILHKAQTSDYFKDILNQRKIHKKSKNVE